MTITSTQLPAPSWVPLPGLDVTPSSRVPPPESGPVPAGTAMRGPAAPVGR